MKKIKLFLILLIFLLTSNKLMAESKSIYDFNFLDIEGNKVELSIFKGKPLLIVNTASRCGFTPQYEGLQNLFTKYRKTDLTIIATTPDDIKRICLVNYNVGFITSSPIEVKGIDIHPMYEWIKKNYNQSPKWNFYKYLFNRSGKLEDSWSSVIKPDSKKIIKKINNLI